jgi:hypothetical protein
MRNTNPSQPSDSAIPCDAFSTKRIKRRQASTWLALVLLSLGFFHAIPAQTGAAQLKSAKPQLANTNPRQLTGPAAIAPCEPINTQLDGSLFPCPQSPVGFCAVGEVLTGLLKGTKEAVYLGASLAAGMPNAEPPSTLAYSGTQVFHTANGDLHMSVVGVSDNARLVFTEVGRITGGTGRFSNATGNLFISGTLTADGSGFQSKVTGAICFDRTQ